jgi:Calcineurin-like phosphoesterase
MSGTPNPLPNVPAAPDALIAQPLAQHLGDVIDHLTQFRNTVDSPKRLNLLNALRQVQAEAKAQNIVAGGSVPQTAMAIAGLPSAGKLAEAIGVREILGFGPYEALDHQWVESVLNYYKTGRKRVPFPTHRAAGIDPVRNLAGDSEIRIAIAGDSGADSRITAPAAIAKLIDNKRPHYTIHLGDVYYSGLANTEESNFLSIWPAGSEGTYTLNSNHEMYCGGDGYFNVLLANPRFAAQQRLSYFVLTNDVWLIIGLDTAYFAYYQSLLYEEGSLAESDTNKQPDGLVQLQWLREVLAQNPNKRVILLSHHDGFDVNPVTRAVSRKPLLRQVMGEFSRVQDWWWYFGHVHAPIVYQRIFFGNNSSVSARCVGHGAVPYEPFPHDLAKLGDAQVRVQWSETDLARNGGDSRRAPNGFLLLPSKARKSRRSSMTNSVASAGRIFEGGRSRESMAHSRPYPASQAGKLFDDYPRG